MSPNPVRLLANRYFIELICVNNNLHLYFSLADGLIFSQFRLCSVVLFLFFRNFQICWLSFCEGVDWLASWLIQSLSLNANYNTCIKITIFYHYHLNCGGKIFNYTKRFFSLLLLLKEKNSFFFALGWGSKFNFNIPFLKCK